MGKGHKLLTAVHRATINEKYKYLTELYNLDRIWPSTVLDETEELQVFLLTDPTFNDLEEYLIEKSTNWKIALGSEPKDSPHLQGKKIIDIYDTLIDFVDGLDDDDPR